MTATKREQKLAEYRYWVACYRAEAEHCAVTRDSYKAGTVSYRMWESFRQQALRRAEVYKNKLSEEQ